MSGSSKSRPDSKALEEGAGRIVEEYTETPQEAFVRRQQRLTRMDSVPSDQASRPAFLTRTLWRVAGADAEILTLCPPTDGYLYRATGISILATGVLGGISLWFALHDTLRATQWLSALIAIAWAAFVVNLDRWIVASIPRSRRGLGASLALTLPRLILSLVLATAMATPLTLTIFQPEVSQQISERQASERQDLAKEYDSQLTPLAVTIGKLQGEVRAEELGLNGSPPGAGPAYVRLRSELAQAQDAYARLGEQKQQALRDLAAAQSQTGLLERLSALNDVTSSNTTARAAQISVQLLLSVLFFLPSMLAVLTPRQTSYQLLVDMKIEALVARTRRGLDESQLSAEVGLDNE